MPAVRRSIQSNKYRINEIFFSLQGEGARVGTPNIFVRFSGCNQACWFCDTQHARFMEMTADDIQLRSEGWACKNVILTGGEPLLQVDLHLMQVLKRSGFFLALETNGTLPILPGFDYIACSPKPPLIAVIPKVDEVRVPIAAQGFGSIEDYDPQRFGYGAPLFLPIAEHYFLSPIFDGQHLVQANLDRCLQIIERYPIWRLSVQLHKLLKIR
jgi:organic radical activating enzyme